MAKSVILGAGIAGHTAATLLRKKLGHGHEIVVISPDAEWNWIPSNRAIPRHHHAQRHRLPQHPSHDANRRAVMVARFIRMELAVNEQQQRYSPEALAVVQRVRELMEKRRAEGTDRAEAMRAFEQNFSEITEALNRTHSLTASPRSRSAGRSIRSSRASSRPQFVSPI